MSGTATATLLHGEIFMDDEEIDFKMENLVIGFTEAYNEALDSGDKVLSNILREELRKLLTDSGPMFKISNNSDLIPFDNKI